MVWLAVWPTESSENFIKWGEHREARLAVEIEKINPRRDADNAASDHEVQLVSYQLLLEVATGVALGLVRGSG
jgi:CRISPR/Cas system-associated exonuclease Cas4 (RecB family)